MDLGSIGRFITSLLVLGILIFVHELGHFLFAKLFRVGVLEFAIGFGNKIFSYKYGDTTYSLRAIPLGGFVRMVGDDPTLVNSQQGTIDNPAHFADLTPSELEMAKDQNRWFLLKKYYQKLLIVFAGPLFNILFAFFASVAFLAIFGDSVYLDKPIIGHTIPEQPADKAGLKENDRVISINDVPVLSWDQLANTIATSGGINLRFKIERRENNENSPKILDLEVKGTTDENELDVISGVKNETRYRIGIIPAYERQPVTAFEAVVGGAYSTIDLCFKVARGMIGMFTGAISTKNIGGPISIFKEAANSAQRGSDSLLNFAIFLSVSLGVLNLMPIPILDGGHILFFTLEKIKGAAFGKRFYVIANNVGMVLLMGLMIFAFGNDLSKIFFK